VLNIYTNSINDYQPESLLFAVFFMIGVKTIFPGQLAAQGISITLDHRHELRDREAQVRPIGAEQDGEEQNDKHDQQEQPASAAPAARAAAEAEPALGPVIPRI
jgi:hypothetical protein